MIENLATRAPRAPAGLAALRPLDVGRDARGGRHLVGRHDFAAFQAADCASEHAVRELRRLDVLGEAGGRIELVVEATAFVKHMVRNLVGTLVEVGQGRRPGLDAGAARVARPDARRADRAAAGALPRGGVLLSRASAAGLRRRQAARAAAGEPPRARAVRLSRTSEES